MLTVGKYSSIHNVTNFSIQVLMYMGMDIKDSGCWLLRLYLCNLVSHQILIFLYSLHI